MQKEPGGAVTEPLILGLAIFEYHEEVRCLFAKSVESFCFPPLSISSKVVSLALLSSSSEASFVSDLALCEG